MLRMLITSLRFRGQAEAIYNADGVLVKIDCTDCQMDADTMAAFKAKTPTRVKDIERGWLEIDCIATQADFVVTLEDFKRAYPYKRNTHLLAPIWDKMNKADQVKAVHEAWEYRKYCEREKHWYNPKIAASWLKEQQYLNEWKNL